jgi:hypothetical protein
MKASRTVWLLCMVLVSTLAMERTHAQSIGTGSVTITTIGCGMSAPAGSPGTACFLYISGPSVGPAGCSGNSIRWDPSASPNGQVATAQLTAAFMAGLKVNFVLADTCWAEWPSYPTIFYYQINQ